MAQQYPNPPEMAIDESKTYTAVVHTSKGDISLELFASDTPPRGCGPPGLSDFLSSAVCATTAAPARWSLSSPDRLSVGDRDRVHLGPQDDTDGYPARIESLEQFASGRQFEVVRLILDLHVVR